jgi:phytoene dehydrogenase-like protein
MASSGPYDVIVVGGGHNGLVAAAAAIRRSAESFGAEVRTSTPVARIDVRDGGVLGVTTAREPHAADLEEYADRVIDGYTELAPNCKQSVIHRQVIGPWRMEHEYGLIGGNIFHGELSPDQPFHMRPAPGYADFTTPIDGLYQCSSATHGGGGVTGIPALLCSRRVLADQRRRRLARRIGIGRP